MLANTAKPYRGLPMEGVIATWYARNVSKDDEYRRAAMRIAGALDPGADVLDVAAGPGHLAIELAKLRPRLGNAQALPFPDTSFDAVICRSAFKNFTAPVEALNEIERVLRPGGFALIMDLNRETPAAEIDDYVGRMPIGMVSRSMTRFIFRHMLIKRAYARADFIRMVETSRFEACDIRPQGIGIDVWLRKPPAPARQSGGECELSPLLFV